jgi:hypothetical protein
VVTFGMPRAGNDRFAESYRKRGLWDKTVRLRHGSDIVPTVPPACSAPFGLFQFRHVGRLLACDRNGEFAASAVVDHPADATALVSLAETFAVIEEERRERRDRDRLNQDRGARWPGDALTAEFAERLPLFVRDHLQDRYLEALGARFGTLPSEAGATGSADDAGTALDALLHSVGRLLHH